MNIDPDAGPPPASSARRLTRASDGAATLSRWRDDHCRQASPVAWSQNPQPESTGAIVGQLGRLDIALEDHLVQEEAEILPIIHDSLTVEEWDEPHALAVKTRPSGLRPKLILAGMVLENNSASEQRWFRDLMPLPA